MRARRLDGISTLGIERGGTAAGGDAPGRRLACRQGPRAGADRGA